jgi:hypothetical protein
MSEFVILAIGQSNMCQPFGFQNDEHNQHVSSTYSDHVKWYNYETHSYSTDPSMLFQLGYEQPTALSCTSPSKYCANDLIPSKSKIIIIPMACAGTPTTQWTSSGKLFKNTVSACNEVKLKIDLVLWLQGESDVNIYSGYCSRLTNIMNDFKKSIPLWGDAPIICGQISIHNNNATQLNDQIAEFCKTFPNAYEISNSNLPTLSTSIIHYTFDSEMEIGKLFSQKYLSIK